MITDCHVNIWNDEHVQPHYRTQMARVREKGIPEKADAETIIAAMAPVDRAIVFALRYAETIGIDSDVLYYPHEMRSAVERRRDHSRASLFSKTANCDERRSSSLM